MSPDAWRPVPPDPYGHLRPVPCEQARCPIVRGCDRATSKGFLAVACPVLGDRRVALKPFLAVKRRPFREMGEPEPVAPPVFPRLPRENSPPPRRKPKPDAAAE